MIIFRYLLKEIIPQIVSTLIVFCAIIAISQLVRLSEVLIAFGLTFENILLPFLYIITPFMTIIIPISCLFGVMLATSRLSADGEYVALLASGQSLRRLCIPVFTVAGTLYIVGVLCATNLEAWGRREFVQFFYRKTQTELDNMVRFRIQPKVFIEDFLGYTFYAEEISSDRVHYKNIMLTPGPNIHQEFVLTAPSGKISGAVETGDLRMAFTDGIVYKFSTDDVVSQDSSVMPFSYAEIDILRMFENQILGADTKKDDYRSYTSMQLYQYIDTLISQPDSSQEELRKAQYLYHSRLANPFATIALACFALVLGLQEQRHGKNRGFLLSVVAVIAAYVLMMSFKWLAEQGFIYAPLAPWVPQFILLITGGFMVFQKARLPLSENPLALQNLPIPKYLFKLLKSARTGKR